MKNQKKLSHLILILSFTIMINFIKKNFYDTSNLPYKDFVNKKDEQIKEFIKLNKREERLIILTQGNYQNNNDIEQISYEYHATKSGILISRWYSQNHQGRISIYINEKLIYDLTGKSEIKFNKFVIKKGDVVRCFFYYGCIDYYLSILY